MLFMHLHHLRISLKGRGAISGKTLRKKGKTAGLTHFLWMGILRFVYGGYTWNSQWLHFTFTALFTNLVGRRSGGGAKMGLGEAEAAAASSSIEDLGSSSGARALFQWGGTISALWVFHIFKFHSDYKAVWVSPFLGPLLDFVVLGGRDEIHATVG